MENPATNDAVLRPNWLASWHRPLHVPSWPPEEDWVVSEDKDGNPISFYGDHYWDFGMQAGRCYKLHFSGWKSYRKIEQLGKENAELLRRVITWRMWGTNNAIGLSAIKSYFLAFRKVFVLCEKNGILANELMHHPKVLEELSLSLAPSNFVGFIADLQRLWDVHDQIGFVLIDIHGIARLKALIPDHDEIQTPYIPPRIWNYQLQRLKELVADFLSHEKQVEECFGFCLDVYERNFGSDLYSAGREKKHRNPFQEFPENAGCRTNVRYEGNFSLTATRFGIRELLDRWIDPGGKGFSIRCFSAYLSLVQAAGIGFICNFSLQRISEACALRSDCLVWDSDPAMGRIPIICGEVTKSDPDSDARWIVHPCVQAAINAITIVARLRMRCALKNPVVNVKPQDAQNPYLLSRPFEPWGRGAEDYPYECRPLSKSYGYLITHYSKLFDSEQLLITPQDMDIAEKLTPGLRQKDGYRVGEPWPLNWHQLRRTGAVNMTASGLVSDASLQFQLKHSNRLMANYYGRGHAKLKLNREVAESIYSAVHENMARAMLAAAGDRFVSPQGEARKQAILVSLVSTKDVKKLKKAAEDGLIAFRETRLGACAKQSSCEYGGLESIARCAGGDGRSPCSDAIFDRSKRATVVNDLTRLNAEFETLPADSPRRRALEVERQSMENFLNVVSK